MSIKNPGAINPGGFGYAAASLGLSPVAQGAGSVAEVLRNQLAEQAKKRMRRQPTSPQSMSLGSPAVFDLFGATPNG